MQILIRAVNILIYYIVHTTGQISSISTADLSREKYLYVTAKEYIQCKGNFGLMNIPHFLLHPASLSLNSATFLHSGGQFPPIFFRSYFDGIVLVYSGKIYRLSLSVYHSTSILAKLRIIGLISDPFPELVTTRGAQGIFIPRDDSALWKSRPQARYTVQKGAYSIPIPVSTT